MNEKNNNQKALDKYCIDLTRLAREGKIDPVVGRHEEIWRVLSILSRRTKNNPLLIGEPGVGKTAVVEGIAHRIIANDVPQSLHNATIYSLDLGLLLGGAKYQGEFEERLKTLLKEIDELPQRSILFIDEIHMIVGAGGAGGAMDASNLLKPALARGSIHCIGATTLAEWKKYIEKDAALERRFQRVLVEEPTQDDAVSILRGLKERYELHHAIKIKDQAIVAAVKLSSQYITDRFLPDKAIDLIDEAASMLKMIIDSHPPELDRLERNIRQLEIEKIALSKESDDVSKNRLEALENELLKLIETRNDLTRQWNEEKKPLKEIARLKSDIEKEEISYQSAEREGNFERASKIKYGILAELKKKLSDAEAILSRTPGRLIKNAVDEHDIASVVARWTNIPVKRLTESETQKLGRLELELQERIIGQHEATNEVARAIQMHKLGMVDPNKPVGSFLFLGPTGVGKTEVARVLADVLFDNEHHLIRIDMSEYMEKHSVSRLIGAPPGYIGYEEGGQLSEALRHRPYSVILLDEFEKAHPEVWNVLLQVLDDGRLTDGQGRIISAKQAIIIMTSNIGAEMIMKAKSVDERLVQELMVLVKKTIKPEIINRIDSIVVFNKLSHQAIEKIVVLQMNSVVKRLITQHITLTYSPEVVSWIAKNAFDEEFGARPIKRFVQREVVYAISQFLMKDVQGLAEKKEKNIDLTIQNDEIVVLCK